MAVNGRIPTSELVFVGNDVDGQPAYLHKGAAADWFAMKAACLKEAGVPLTISGGGGAYRTFALQEYYYDQYRNHGGANAADPGTSNHGWGKAVDIYNWSRAYGWLLANCGRWGFQNNYAPEGWHYQHLSDTAVAPLPDIEFPKENPMSKPTIVFHKSGANMAYIVQRQFSERIFPENEIKHLCKIHGIDFDKDIPEINDQDRDVMARDFKNDIIGFIQLVDQAISDEHAETLATLRTAYGK